MRLRPSRASLGIVLLQLLISIHDIPKRASAYSARRIIPPHKVVVSNENFVEDVWIVKELQLFFGQCREERPVPVTGPGVYFSSGNRFGDQSTTTDKAFDGKTDTSFEAYCGGAGGCSRHQAYVGMDIQGTAEYQNAFSGTSAEALIASEVNCIRFMGSSLPRHKSTAVSVLEVVPGQLMGSSAEWVFRTHATYYVAGDVWSRRPAEVNALWRMRNAAPTDSRWGVTELEFFEDVFCTTEAKGAVMSSGFHTIADSDLGAIDGNHSTGWVASCNTISADGRFIGCAAEEAWVGMDYSQDPKMVQCFRIMQTPHSSGGAEAVSIRTSAGFLLDAWDGAKWVLKERVWNPQRWHSGLPEPTLLTPFLLGKPGEWEDTRPPDRTAWRLLNDIWVQRPWKVHELQLFEALDCSGAPIGVTAPVEAQAVSMLGPHYINIAKQAFDGDWSSNNYFETNCTYDAGGCLPGEAWIGVYLRVGDSPQQERTIQCFRIFQARWQEHQAQSIALSKWENGQWVSDFLHRDIGGGGWHQRPAVPWTMWRVINNDPIEARWRVHELRVFTDDLCLRPLEGGTPISSGFLDYLDNFENVFDGYVRTSWAADCLVCNQSRRYWVGMQLPGTTPHANLSIDLIRCVKIWQSLRFEEQTESIRVDVWDGLDWTHAALSSNGIVGGGGGGTWHRYPAALATKWRLVAQNLQPGSGWRLHDLELYSDSRCTQRIRQPPLQNGGAGAQVILSGYTPDVTASESFLQALFTEAAYGMDGDATTSLLITDRSVATLLKERNLSLVWNTTTTPSPLGVVDSTSILDFLPDPKPAWFGVDLLSEALWVRCVRVKQGALKSEQAPTLHLQHWTGFEWTQSDDSFPDSTRAFEHLGGAGWQRRPANDGTIWRLENANHVPEGWAIYEAELHSDGRCGRGSGDDDQSGPLQGEPVGSGSVLPLEDFGIEKAFDSDHGTAWKSQCSAMRSSDLPPGVSLPGVGCAPGEAWLGLDFTATSQVVRCIRVLQVGYGPVQSESIIISKWDGHSWRAMWRADGLGGSAWNQRPALPNSMWRLRHAERRKEVCPRQLTRPTPRPWGIMELSLYEDDDCGRRLEDGIPISSGTIENYRATLYDSDSYDLARAFDGDEETEWVANCDYGWETFAPDLTKESCVNSWIGLDFGDRPVKARCFKVMQSRRDSPVCCDPASVLVLERWNGTAWVEASYKHYPPTGYPDPPRDLGMRFIEMGSCHGSSDSRSGLELKMWEERGRRASDSCKIPLAGSTILLGDPACIEHPDCVEAFGPGGQCCPQFGSENRCCCSFLANEDVFEDDNLASKTREQLQVERAIIILSDILPFLGAPMPLVMYIAAVTFPADVQKRTMRWRDEPRAAHPRLRRFCFWFISPLVYWRSFLAKPFYELGRIGYHYQMFFRWFCQPGGHNPRGLQWLRGVFFVLCGGFLAGALPWVAGGMLMGFILLKLLLFVSLIVRLVRSPFDPDDEEDMALMCRITGEPLRTETHTATITEVAENFLGSVVQTFAYFFKFCFDLVIMRAQMISFGAIEPINAEQIVDIFPGLMKLLQDPVEIMFMVMDWGSYLLTWVISISIGVPQCEGSVVLIGSVILIMILFTLSKWLNYDFFGLFSAARQTARASRPPAQRAMAQGCVLACQAIVFGGVQAGMVLFSRILTLSNPFREAKWACVFDDMSALILGRGLLAVSSVVGLAFFWLCVNGHFIGQDYIVKPVGRFLGMDFDELDPDGTGPSGGLFDCSVQFAIVPTWFGIWLDRWNVAGFKVEERARIYATQLRDPQPCIHCGCRHVKYNMLMLATARQVSVAAQIVPYGIIAGKGTEYFNDPPMLYCGTKLPCSAMNKSGTIPWPAGRKSCGMWLLLAGAYSCSFIIEFILPMMRRAISVSIYIVLLATVFYITEDNLVRLGRKLLETAFALCCAKALSDLPLDSLTSFILGLLVEAILTDETKEIKFDLVRVVAGQLAFGSLLAGIVTYSSHLAGWMSTIPSIIFGSLLAYSASLAMLLLNLAVEQQPGARKTIVPTMLKLVFSFGIGGMTMALVAPALLLRTSMAVTLLATCGVFFVLRLVFLEKPLPRSAFHHPDISRLEFIVASPTYNVLTSRRFLPGLVGVSTSAVVAAAVTPLVYEATKLSSSATAGIFTAVGLSFPSGVCSGLVVLAILDNNPLLLGLFVGVGVTTGFAPWNWLTAIALGVFIGTLVGAGLEERVVLEHWKEDEQHRMGMRSLLSRQRSTNTTDTTKTAVTRAGQRLSMATGKALAVVTSTKRISARVAPISDMTEPDMIAQAEMLEDPLKPDQAKSIEDDDTADGGEQREVEADSQSQDTFQQAGDGDRPDEAAAAAEGQVQALEDVSPEGAPRVPEGSEELRKTAAVAEGSDEHNDAVVAVPPGNVQPAMLQDEGRTSTKGNELVLVDAFELEPDDLPSQAQSAALFSDIPAFTDVADEELFGRWDRRADPAQLRTGTVLGEELGRRPRPRSKPKPKAASSTFQKMNAPEKVSLATSARKGVVTQRSATAAQPGASRTASGSA